MIKKKPQYVREWHFERYFMGKHVRTFPLDTTEEEIVEILNKEILGNWYPHSLCKGKKVKQR